MGTLFLSNFKSLRKAVSAFCYSLILNFIENWKVPYLICWAQNQIDNDTFFSTTLEVQSISTSVSPHWPPSAPFGPHWPKLAPSALGSPNRPILALISIYQSLSPPIVPYHPLSTYCAPSHPSFILHFGPSSCVRCHGTKCPLLMTFFSLSSPYRRG